MNKETFLNELRGYLQILEDQEQEDILEEYAQHIDMKLQKGLSEEKAISDFGPVKELAAEILEAYHVKPQFQKGALLVKLPGLGGGQKGNGKNLFKRAGQFLKAKFTAMRNGIRNGCRWAGEKCRAFGKWIAGLFQRREKKRPALQESAGAELLQEDGKGILSGQNNAAPALLPEKKNQKKRQSENTGRGRRKMSNFFGITGHALAALWHMLLRFCIWWLRFFWNAAWLMFSFFCAAMAMIVLMGIGAMIIFLLKGYPVFGMLVMSIGGLLCFGSLSMGAFSLLIKKNKEEQREKEDKSGTKQSVEEVQYEEMA